MPEGKHIRGREATYMAIENDKRLEHALSTGWKDTFAFLTGR